MHPKEDTHHDNHTLRKRIHIRSVEKKDRIEREYKYIGNKYGYYITDIDEMIDNKRFTLSGNSIPINSPIVWENLEDTLNEFAKYKNIKLDSIGGKYTEYTLPSIKFIEYSNAKNTENEDTYMIKWNNEYYDNRYIYKFMGKNDSSGILTKLFLIHSEPPVFENMPNINRMAVGIFSSEPKYLCEYHGYISRQHVFHNQNNKFIQFEFNELKRITHIGTMGRYPNQRYFPSKLHSGSVFYNHWKKQQSKYNTLKVCEQEDLHYYVMTYEIHYRGTNGKWISLGRFTGNKNVDTENINKVDILARYIRITPLTYRGTTPSMRIAIYGETSIGSTNNNSDLSAGESIRMSQELIKYTLEHSINPNKKVPDGKGIDRNYCCRFVDRTKHNKPTTTQILQEHHVTANYGYNYDYDSDDDC